MPSFAAPVAVSRFGIKTRCHGGGNYLGNAKLYGSVGGASDGTGASWVELGHISGDGVCAWVGPTSITDSTAYSFFRLTTYGAGRGTYESFGMLQIQLADNYKA